MSTHNTRNRIVIVCVVNIVPQRAAKRCSVGKGTCDAVFSVGDTVEPLGSRQLLQDAERAITVACTDLGTDIGQRSNNPDTAVSDPFCDACGQIALLQRHHQRRHQYLVRIQRFFSINDIDADTAVGQCLVEQRNAVIAGTGDHRLGHVHIPVLRGVMERNLGFDAGVV